MAGAAGQGDIPVTPAIRFWRENEVAFEPALYTYVEHGGTGNAARQLGAPEHAVVKTIVLETDRREPLICLMHGDREISTKALARALGVKSVRPCDPASATKHTGYMIGGTSPFGTRKTLPVCVEETIFALPDMWINAGHRGLLARLKPAALELLTPKRVAVAIVPGARQG